MEDTADTEENEDDTSIKFGVFFFFFFFFLQNPKTDLTEFLFLFIN